MKLILNLLAFIICMPISVHAGQRVTLYLDGGLVEREIRAIAGVAEITLSSSVESGSVRIVPPLGVTLLEVQRQEVRPTKQQRKELALLEEREKQLQDRLRALAVKEEIYRGAAKSQSAKAPRKTKANPEPLSTIKQGTDYAISQLESVIRSQRRTGEELAVLRKDLERRRGEANVGGTQLRIRADRRDALLRVSYLQKDLFWRPTAELRFAGNTGELLLTGGLPPLPAGTTVMVVPVSMGDVSVAPKAVTGSPRLSFPLTAVQEELLPGMFTSFRYRFASQLPYSSLPSALSCYRDREYLGAGSLQQTPEPSVLEIVCGR